MNRRCASSKRETQFRLIDIADFRKFFEQLRQKPEQERGIEPGGICISLSADRMLMYATPVPVNLDEIGGS